MTSRAENLTFSIAMATYNGEDFLLEQLESIASQTRLPDELVVCDDASTDHTIAVLKDYEKKAVFPVRIFQNSATLGSTANFERAIKLCREDVVVLSDQDDIWNPDRIKNICRAFKQNPSAVGVFSNAELIDRDGRSLHKTIWGSLRLSKQEQKALTTGGFPAFKVLLRRNIITGAAFAFKRKGFLETADNIPESWVHDAWIAINLVREGPIELIDDCLVGYRQHGANQIGIKSISIQKRLKNAESVSDAERRMFVLRQKLTDQGVEERFLTLVDRKIGHLKIRIDERSCVLKLFQEFFLGRYGEYSAGVRSFVKDLFGRFINR